MTPELNQSTFCGLKKNPSQKFTKLVPLKGLQKYKHMEKTLRFSRQNKFYELWNLFLYTRGDLEVDNVIMPSTDSVLFPMLNMVLDQ